MSISFKTPRVRDEFVELATKNHALSELLIELADYVSTHFKQDLTLTSILRTPEEQAALYVHSAHKVLKSTHMEWKAVDLRSLVFTKAEIDEIVKFLNGKYKNKDGRPVALYHTVLGGAPHFHIQLTGDIT